MYDEVIKYIITMGKVRILENISTRKLMKWRNFCYKFGGKYSPGEDSIYYNIDEVKNELDKREHIPNKLEAKKIRREMAKKGR